MRSILAILRKDIRHLWPQIAVFLIVMTLSAVVGAESALRTSFDGNALGVVALLACYYLIAAEILQEPLAGDRQYWLTRPFSRRQLLAEKGIFLVLFINLPALLTQITILLLLGISPLQHLDALFWRQLFLCGQVILPAMALCAATRNFAQLLLLSGIVIAAFQIPHRFFYAAFIVVQVAPPWFGPAVRLAVLILAASIVIYYQYARRILTYYWLALGALAIVFFILTQYHWDDPFPRTTITLEAPAPGPHPTRRFEAAIPLRIPAIPPGAEASISHVRVTIYDRDYKFAGDYRGAAVRGLTSRPTLILPLREHLPDLPLHLSGTIDFTLFQRLDSNPLPGEGQHLRVPGVGICTERAATFYPARLDVLCLAPSIRTALALEFPNRDLNWIIPPGQLDLPGTLAASFQPFDLFAASPKTTEGNEFHTVPAQNLLTVRTLGSYRGIFYFPSIRLADYPEPE